MKFRRGISLIAAVFAAGAAARAAEDDAATPDQTAKIALHNASKPGGGAIFPIQVVLDSLSDSLGLSFIFDSRILSDKAIKPVGPESDSEKALARALSAVDLELHRVADKTFAITEAAPGVFVAPDSTLATVPPDDPIDTIVVMASAPLASEAAGSRRLFKIDADDLAYLNATNIAEAIYDLPQSLASVTPSNTALYGSAAGLSLADLRGLEPKRTMALLNGRRGTITSGGNGDIGGFDLNAVAEPFIERIEILNLPGGARFGSAAVAGAVNFVTKSNLEGVETGVKASMSEYGDAETLSLYALAGRTFGDFGNITIGIDVARVEGLIGADRPFSSTPYGFALNGVRSSSPDAMFLPGFGGSSTTGEGQFNGVLLESGEMRPFSGNTVWLPQADETIERYVGAADQLFNWYAWQSLTLPNERILGLFSFNRDVSDYGRFFIDFQGGVSATDGQLAPLPSTRLRGSDRVTGDAAVIPLDNPTLPQSIRDLAIAEFGSAARAIVFDHRFVELGPRRLRIDRRYNDLAAGLEFETAGGAEFSFIYKFGRNSVVSKERDRVDLAKLQIALNPAFCATTPGCIGVDFFGAPAITPQALDFIRAPELRNRVTTSEHVISLAASAPIKFNDDERGRFSAGVDLRRSVHEALDITPSGVSPIGRIASGDQRNIERSIDGFAEIETPLFRSQAFPGAVDATLGARISQSSASGTAMNFEGGLDWRPIAGVTLFTRQLVGSRAPNLIELFGVGPTLETFFFDPCADAPASSAIAANCFSAGPLGVPSGFSQTAMLTSVTTYGNPDLEPEQVRSQAYGVSIAPTDFAPTLPGRFQLTATWLDYKISDAVATDGNSLLSCYESQNFSSAHCGLNPRTGKPLIIRDPLSSQIVAYDILLANSDELRWRGLDLEARYTTKPASIPLFDSIWLSALHTYVNHVGIGSNGGEPLRHDGLIRFPKHRTLISLGADIGSWSFVAYGNRRGRALTAETSRPEARVPSAFYLDTTIRFDLSELAYIQASVQNITDKEPAITAFNDVGNFAPEFYDPIGRRYSIAIRLNF